MAALLGLILCYYEFARWQSTSKSNSGSAAKSAFFVKLSSF
jgi:hypothetical protein